MCMMKVGYLMYTGGMRELGIDCGTPGFDYVHFLFIGEYRNGLIQEHEIVIGNWQLPGERQCTGASTLPDWGSGVAGWLDSEEKGLFEADRKERGLH